jgi:ribosomal protein S18 acetylase RimI-like enzyme
VTSPNTPRTEVTRTHLELRAPGELRAARIPAPVPLLRHLRPVAPAEYLALYRLVGERWHWRDRLAWSDDELADYLARASVEIWIAESGSDTAGYFELQRHAGDDVELMYFGLAPTFIGRGLGGWLLARAVERAFAIGARRVVLNTCTLDGPHALPNYLARGFRIVREERYEVSL